MRPRYGSTRCPSAARSSSSRLAPAGGRRCSPRRASCGSMTLVDRAPRNRRRPAAPPWPAGAHPCPRRVGRAGPPGRRALHGLLAEPRSARPTWRVPGHLQALAQTRRPARASSTRAATQTRVPPIIRHQPTTCPFVASTTAANSPSPRSTTRRLSWSAAMHKAGFVGRERRRDEPLLHPGPRHGRRLYSRPCRCRSTDRHGRLGRHGRGHDRRPAARQAGRRQTRSSPATHAPIGATSSSRSYGIAHGRGQRAPPSPTRTSIVLAIKPQMLVRVGRELRRFTARGPAGDQHHRRRHDQGPGQRAAATTRSCAACPTRRPSSAAA